MHGIELRLGLRVAVGDLLELRLLVGDLRVELARLRAAAKGDDARDEHHEQHGHDCHADREVTRLEGRSPAIASVRGVCAPAHLRRSLLLSLLPLLPLLAGLLEVAVAVELLVLQRDAPSCLLLARALPLGLLVPGALVWLPWLVTGALSLLEALAFRLALGSCARTAFPLALVVAAACAPAVSASVVHGQLLIFTW